MSALEYKVKERGINPYYLEVYRRFTDEHEDIFQNPYILKNYNENRRGGTFSTNDELIMSDITAIEEMVYTGIVEQSYELGEIYQPLSGYVLAAARGKYVQREWLDRLVKLRNTIEEKLWIMHRPIGDNPLAPSLSQEYLRSK